MVALLHFVDPVEAPSLGLGLGLGLANPNPNLWAQQAWRHAQQLTNDVGPVGAAAQRRVVLVPPHLRSEAGHIGRRDVRRVTHDHVKPLVRG